MLTSDQLFPVAREAGDLEAGSAGFLDVTGSGQDSFCSMDQAKQWPSSSADARCFPSAASCAGMDSVCMVKCSHICRHVQPGLAELLRANKIVLIMCAYSSVSGVSRRHCPCLHINNARCCRAWSSAGQQTRRGEFNESDCPENNTTNKQPPKICTCIAIFR